MTSHRIDVLVFDGCPNASLALDRVEEALRSAPQQATVRVVRVETEARAQETGFLGSPSVRVDDVDVEPAARARTDCGLQCRVYPTADGIELAPPVAWIVAALAGVAPSSLGGQAAESHGCCEKK